jgi:hypothetical protein
MSPPASEDLSVANLIQVQATLTQAEQAERAVEVALEHARAIRAGTLLSLS